MAITSCLTECKKCRDYSKLYNNLLMEARSSRLFLEYEINVSIKRVADADILNPCMR